MRTWDPSSKRLKNSWNAPGHFHIFLSGYSWCLLIFGTILMVQLVLSFLELKPHFPRFLFAYKESTMIHVFCKNALIPYDQNNLVKFQLVASLPVTLFRLVGLLASSQKRTRGLHDVFQNWIRTKKCLKNSTFRGSIFGWLQKNGYMTSPRWVVGSRLIQKLTSIGGFAPHGGLKWSTGQLLTEGS